MCSQMDHHSHECVRYLNVVGSKQRQTTATIFTQTASIDNAIYLHACFSLHLEISSNNPKTGLSPINVRLRLRKSMHRYSQPSLPGMHQPPYRPAFYSQYEGHHSPRSKQEKVNIFTQKPLKIVFTLLKCLLMVYSGA